QYYRLGPAIDRRDDKSVRRTASGLLKLAHPDGAFTGDDVRWALELGLEMRRRVKEQLKRMGGLEYWQTRFTYTDAASPNAREREVELRERLTEGLLASSELPPGRLYAVGRDFEDRRPCVFRIEVELIPGTGRATLSGARTKTTYDAVHTAHDHVRNRLSEL